MGLLSGSVESIHSASSNRVEVNETLCNPRFFHEQVLFLIPFSSGRVLYGSYMKACLEFDNKVTVLGAYNGLRPIRFRVFVRFGDDNRAAAQFSVAGTAAEADKKENDFDIRSESCPIPDKRDKCLYKIIFCQKRTENHFLGTNGRKYLSIQL